jgi:lytic murein transglycosylase
MPLRLAATRLAAAFSLVVVVGALSALTPAPASAAQCGNTASGFDAWKQQFAKEAAAQGIGRAGIAALMATSYSYPTIRADRSHHGMNVSLADFMRIRGANAIIAKGRREKAANAALFAEIQRRYGVPAGPIIAVWGMETAFGAFMGDTNTLSAAATLAYDCRRQAYFTDQFMAALQLVDRGEISSSTIGAKQGEVGQTQFLPKNYLLYGVDGDGDGRVDLRDKADALASTANYFKGHGWIPGAGYQPGQPNYAAIQAWNAAPVYEQAIAIIGAAIDKG